MRNHVQLADAYYRLSDEERKYGESASITNQRTIVREYCEKHGLPNNFDYVDPTKGEEQRECGLHLAH